MFYPLPNIKENVHSEKIAHRKPDKEGDASRKSNQQLSIWLYELNAYDKILDDEKRIVNTLLSVNI